MNKISASLQSIDEEVSPRSIRRQINYSLQQGGSMNSQDWTNSTLTIPLSTFNTSNNNSPLEIKLFPSLNSPASSSSSSFNLIHASEIELKKSQLLQKYRNSLAKKESPKIFQNQLKTIIKKRMQTSSAQNLSYFQSLDTPTTKRSQSFNSNYNNPQEFLSLRGKEIQKTKQEKKKKRLQNKFQQQQQQQFTFIKKMKQNKAIAAFLLFLLGFFLSKILDILSQVQQHCQQFQLN